MKSLTTRKSLRRLVAGAASSALVAGAMLATGPAAFAGVDAPDVPDMPPFPTAQPVLHTDTASTAFGEPVTLRPFENDENVEGMSIVGLSQCTAYEGTLTMTPPAGDAEPGTLPDFRFAPADGSEPIVATMGNDARLIIPGGQWAVGTPTGESGLTASATFFADAAPGTGLAGRAAMSIRVAEEVSAFDVVLTVNREPEASVGTWESSDDELTFTPTNPEGGEACAAVQVAHSEYPFNLLGIARVSVSPEEVATPARATTIGSDRASVKYRASKTIDVLKNDRRAGQPALDASSLKLVKNGKPVSSVKTAGGTFSVTKGKVRFTAAKGFVGKTTASYRVTNADGVTGTASVKVTVKRAAASVKATAKAQGEGKAKVSVSVQLPGTPQSQVKAKLKVYNGSKLVKSKQITVKKGKGTVVLSGLKAGKRTIKVVFPGNKYYTAKTAKAKVAVR